MTETDKTVLIVNDMLRDKMFKYVSARLEEKGVSVIRKVEDFDGLFSELNSLQSEQKTELKKEVFIVSDLIVGNITDQATVENFLDFIKQTYPWVQLVILSDIQPSDENTIRYFFYDEEGINQLITLITHRDNI